MKNYKVILLAFLVGITIFSVFKYIMSLKEKNDLLNTLNQMRAQVSALENEKQSLLGNLKKEKELQQKLAQENTALKENLKVDTDKFAELEAGLAQSQKAVEELNAQISVAKAENDALRNQSESLKQQINQVSQERDNLKAKLSSLAELKKSIRELKIQMRKVRTEIKQTTVETKRIIEGNRGYLIKDGKPTYPAKVRIEVTPLPVNE